MLELLHIENIAVIQEADIQFRPGFNALTGETGAGKSIVIDAMGAVPGWAHIPGPDPHRRGPGLCQRRVLQVAADRTGAGGDRHRPGRGRSSAAAAGADRGRQEPLPGHGLPVTVAQLRRIGEELLNIHGQHDGQQLLDEGQH